MSATIAQNYSAKQMTSWEVVSEILKGLESMTAVGINLLELEAYTEDKIKELGAQSCNKGYQPKWANSPFPSVLCTSVNDVVTHGIPTDYELQDGDIVTYDLGVKKDGLCADAALTSWAGKLADRDERLLRYAKRTLYKGIGAVKAGVPVNDVSSAMYWYAKQMGFILNISFSGHGIGKEMHEEPTIPHTVDVPGITDVILKEGQMICLEPILTYKDPFGELQPDGWTVKTTDGRKAAMFEHQLRVTKEGCDILTTHIKE